MSITSDSVTVPNSNGIETAPVLRVGNCLLRTLGNGNTGFFISANDGTRAHDTYPRQNIVYSTTEHALLLPKGCASLKISGDIDMTYALNIKNADGTYVVKDGIAVTTTPVPSYDGNEVIGTSTDGHWVCDIGKAGPVLSVMSVPATHDYCLSPCISEANNSQHSALTLIGRTGNSTTSAGTVSIRPNPTEPGVVIANADLNIDSSRGVLNGFFIGKTVSFGGASYAGLALELEGPKLKAPNPSFPDKEKALVLEGNFRLSKYANIFDADGNPIVLSGKRVD